jgi:hypothetical protein
MGIEAKRLYFTNCCSNVLFKVHQRLYFDPEDTIQELNVSPIFADIDSYKEC